MQCIRNAITDLKINQVYAKKARNISNVGDFIEINYSVSPIYEKAFTKNGCALERLDFGMEATRVRRIKPLKPTIKERVLGKKQI